MRILAIETSCDETAVAVLEASKNKIKVLSNIVSSQVKLHAKFGGVVPNLAAREHVKNIEHVFTRALKEAGLLKSDFNSEIDLIAVTRGPGLGPALLAGISFAKVLAWKYSKPLIGVNHLEGHIYSNFLNIEHGTWNKIFPALNLIVSGGHTELVLMEDHGKYKIIGETVDDAVGEAFDKVARLLGLGYPGGPLISKLAEKGDSGIYLLPSPMIKSKDYNFSYSGLKTAVLYLIRDLGGKEKLTMKQKKDIAASFQKAATDVLIRKTIKAAQEFKVKSIMLSGGVSANSLLRLNLNRATDELGIKYSQPELKYTGDNAAMIGMAGYFSAKGRSVSVGNYDWEPVEMDANLGFK